MWDWILPAIGIGSSLFGIASRPDRVNLDSLIPNLEEGYGNAEEELNRAFDEAMAHLEAGNAEAADAILSGLGMSLAEREKWFDIASDALQPVIDYGKSYQPDARAFMDYAKEIIFDPDAIFGTEAWQAHKTQVVDSVTNSAAAKSGLLSGNYMADLSDYVNSHALEFRNSEINNTLNAFNSTMVPVGMGLNAQTRIGDYALRTGEGSANDIMNAHIALGNIHAGAGGAAAELSYNQGLNQANLDTGLASDLANLQLSQILANNNRDSQFSNSLLGLGGSLLPFMFSGGGGSTGSNYFPSTLPGSWIAPSSNPSVMYNPRASSYTYPNLTDPFDR